MWQIYCLHVFCILVLQGIGNSFQGLVFECFLVLPCWHVLIGNISDETSVVGKLYDTAVFTKLTQLRKNKLNS